MMQSLNNRRSFLKGVSLAAGGTLLASLIQKVAAAEDWLRAAASPIERVEAPTLKLNGKLYIFGGFDGGLRPIPRLDVYDASTDSWNRLKDIPLTVTRNGNGGLFVCVAVKNCRFENNQLLENSGSGISIGSRSTDNAFLGNRIISNATHGIEFRNEQADTGAHRNRFERNVVLNNGASNKKGQAAIVIRGHHDDVIFRQNTIGHEKPTDNQNVDILVSRHATGFQSADNQFQHVERGIQKEFE